MAVVRAGIAVENIQLLGKSSVDITQRLPSISDLVTSELDLDVSDRGSVNSVDVYSCPRFPLHWSVRTFSCCSGFAEHER